MLDNGTRTVVRNFVREAVAVTYVIGVLLLFIASTFEIGGVSVTMSDFQTFYIDVWMFLFIGAAGFLVFGKRSIDQAIEVYKMVQDDGEA